MKFEPVPLGNSLGIKLNISDLDLPNKKNLEPYLTFSVRTFKILANEGNDPARFHEVAGASNWYFARASKDEKIKIAQFFALVRQLIATEMETSKINTATSDLVKFIKQLGEMYAAIVDECHLMEAFDQYATEHVQLQDITGYGDRPQDSEDLTFRLDEMRRLMNLAFLTKIVAPIFGELIQNIPDQYDDEGNKKMVAPKEIKVANFFTPLIARHFQDIDYKLDHYIEHIVDNQSMMGNKSAAIFAGLIPATRVRWIKAMLLVRNFVCCNIEKTDSNIVKFVDVIAHSHIISQNNNANKNQVRPRKPASSFGVGEDSDNTAQMETDSVVSNRPFDTCILISAAVDRVIDDFLVERQITHSEMQQCLDYLMEHPVIPTPLNRFLSTAIFGDKLGGGRGIETLDREAYTKLICLLQMISFQLGLCEFGHMLTATKTERKRIIKSAEDNKFILNYGTSYPYRNCRAKFEGSAKASTGKEWDEQMNDIADDLVHTCYTYNTPNFILDQLGDSFDAINGDDIMPEVEIITEACILIDMFRK